MKVSKAQIKEALRKAGGFKTQAAKELGISYQALWKRLKADEDLAAYTEELQEQYIDMAESKLLQKVREGNLGAICFFLKCKGKSRGYVEKQSFDHSSSDGSMSPPTRIEIVAGKDDDT